MGIENLTPQFINRVLSYATWCQENWKYYFEQIGSDYEPKTLCVQDLTIAECCEGIKDMQSTINQYMLEIQGYSGRHAYEIFTDVIESVRHLSFWYDQKELHFADGTVKPNDHANPELSRWCAEQYYFLRELFYQRFADDAEAKRYFFEIDD